MRQLFCGLAVLGLLLAAGPATATEENGNLLPFLQGLSVAGGVSAGEFYLSHSGPESADDQLLLSNLLLEISNDSQQPPIGFTIAAGETSTPSLLGVPDNANDLDIEYAYLSVRPHEGTTIEAGLLQPDSGYEASYTYDNHNLILGAVASQQPYNAYGARLRQELGPLSLSAAYFNERLDDTEYAPDGGSAPDRSWEVVLGGTLAGWDYSLYHYHLAGRRNLTGAVIEQQGDRLLVAFDLDYWHWEQGEAPNGGRRYATGGALYLVPRFGEFFLPLRLEYIDQGTSGVYLEAAEAKTITTVTLSPTYNLTEQAYLRAEAAYVHAREGFAKDDGTPKDDRLALAMEVGYRF